MKTANFDIIVNGIKVAKIAKIGREYVLYSMNGERYYHDRDLNAVKQYAHTNLKGRTHAV